MPYSLALFIHVVSVLALFIALGIEITSMVALRRSVTMEALHAWTRGTAFVGRIFPISAALILVSGLFMLATRWSLNTPWAIISLVALVVLAMLGGAVNGKRRDAIDRAAESTPAGPVPLALKLQINDPVLWTSVQTMTAVAVGVVYLMTTKPGWLASVVCILIALVIGLALAQPAWRRQRALAAAGEGAAGTPRPNLA